MSSFICKICKNVIISKESSDTICSSCTVPKVTEKVEYIEEYEAITQFSDFLNLSGSFPKAMEEETKRLEKRLNDFGYSFSDIERMKEKASYEDTGYYNIFKIQNMEDRIKSHKEIYKKQEELYNELKSKEENKNDSKYNYSYSRNPDELVQIRESS